MEGKKLSIDRAEITRISKEFAEPLYGMFESINGSGWLIVDPLSGYLNSVGYENTLYQIPANEKHPQVLIMTFTDGSLFIPAGADLKSVHPDFDNWQWM